MPSTNRGVITINYGTYSNDCTTENDLISNQAVFPEIRKWIDFANRRALTTLLTSGVVTPYGIDPSKATDIPEVTTRGTSMGIGSNAYQFRIMGRIEKAAVILNQQGGTNADGTFTLRMGDNHLKKGHVCLFGGTGSFVATCLTQPRATSGGFLYDFQANSGDLFNYAVHVATQPGTKTCFPGWTAFGEKSLRGYGESKFPDMFINHMTLQRATATISGDAGARVLWLNYMTTKDGQERTVKGWMPEEVAQEEAKLVIRNERAKWLGVSTMKDANGALLATSRMTEPDSGLPLIQGDGFEEQVAGGNVLYGSGVTGQPTVDDYIDMMSTLEKKGNMISGFTWCMVTGTDGYANFQKEAVNLGGNQNIQFMQSIVQENGKAGGAMVSVGYTFGKINYAGNTLIVIKHPMFDDPAVFPQTTSDGKSVKGSTCYFFPVGESTDGKNMEILHKEANGRNRSKVTAKLSGLTGASETTISQEDADTYAILKQDMLNVNNTQLCGIIYPNT